ncbi:MAG: hypothetical protein M0011_03795 [Elusimicrobia bacterium]|nr:hypothetical protein [Elusimicrobiota bacterium]
MNRKMILAVMMAAAPGAALAAGGAELNGLKAGDVRAQEGVSIPMPELVKSNYPVDYGYQKVHLVNRGPAVLATVGSGMMDTRLIIGYKKSGVLGGAEKITARVMVSYYGGDGRTKLSTRDVELGKEWHGTGFMTPAMIHQDYITLSDNLGFRGIQKIELAFFAGGQWDSNYGSNYTVYMNDLSNSGIQYSNPGWAGSNEVAPQCWDFIVAQMRDMPEKGLPANSFLDSAVRLSRMHSERLKTVAMAINGQVPAAYTRGVGDVSFGIEGALYGMEEAIKERNAMALRMELTRMERFTARLHKLAASIAGTPDYTRLSGYEVESAAAALDAQLLIIRANASLL